MNKKVVVTLLVALMTFTLMFAGTAKYASSSDILAEAKAQIQEITVKDAFNDYFKANKPNVVFIDVREADEVEDGHIPNAVWIARGLLEFKVGSLYPEKDAQIFIVYCKSGGRSALATKTLVDMGYNAISVSGGFTAWSDAKYPSRKGMIQASGSGC